MLVIKFWRVLTLESSVISVDHCHEVREVSVELIHLAPPRFSSLQPFGDLVGLHGWVFLVLCHFLS